MHTKQWISFCTQLKNTAPNPPLLTLYSEGDCPRPDRVSGRAPGQEDESSSGRGTGHYTLHSTCYQPNWSDTLNIYVWRVVGQPQSLHFYKFIFEMSFFKESVNSKNSLQMGFLATRMGYFGSESSGKCFGTRTKHLK